jgi:membrane protease YdiL (CAAX protease family)
MGRMQSFGAVIALVWIGGCIASFFYAQQQHIPLRVAAFTALAFLVEITFYLATSRAAFLRQRLDRLAAPVLWASATVPYLLYAIGRGSFSWRDLGVLLLLAGIASWWYVVAPRGGLTDILFLAFMAAVYLARPFREIYPPIGDGLRVDALGQLMWIRLGVFAVLWFRGAAGIGFGFVPTRAEWITGVRYFLYFLPVGVAVILITRFAQFHVADGWWWKAPATFAGIYLVVALAEELFFRGILQQRLTEWIGPIAGLAGASALFGLVHLWFREFPNWDMVAVAAILGVFCGLAFVRAGSIRAAMVTHALVVATWRALFV